MFDLIVLRDTAERRVQERVKMGARSRGKAYGAESEQRSARRIASVLPARVRASARFAAKVVFANGS